MVANRINCSSEPGIEPGSLLFWYVGHTFTLSGWKSLTAPRWKEAVANGKGVAGDGKSDGY